MKHFYIIILQLLFSCSIYAQSIVMEAENATLTSVSIVTELSGYCGDGMVFMKDSGNLKFLFLISGDAVYNVSVRMLSPFGEKTQTININNIFYKDVKFPESSIFKDVNIGNIPFVGGSNTIEIVKNWGYMYFDKLTLTPVKPAPPIDYSLVEKTLVNTNATLETKDLYRFLRSGYGKRMLSGQCSFWDELTKTAGKAPVVRAFDMQNYSPHNPWGNGSTVFKGWDDGSIKKAIDWYNSTGGKGIVTFQWHWFAPMGDGLGTSTFYTDKTIFDVSKVSDHTSDEYKAIINDIDAIAVQLKRLKTAEIPVLWRPLHEAGGGWFWWGAKGPDVCLELYNLMYDRLTNYHHINNLIWVWSTPEKGWYPGNNKVDIIGYDSYPSKYVYSTQKSVFDDLFDITNGKKMIALTENGPIPDVDLCFKQDTVWLYFVSWNSLVKEQNSVDHIHEVFNNKKVVTLENYDSRISESIPSE